MFAAGQCFFELAIFLAGLVTAGIAYWFRRNARGNLYWPYAFAIGRLAKRAWRQKRKSLKRDGFKSNRNRALVYYLRMIFSENRCTLFRIVRYL